ncbi:MAG: MarR family winged helix-turn-helix transcriptional regulator, partial [Candidatus Krumholzibacteriia bacterium]
MARVSHSEDLEPRQSGEAVGEALLYRFLRYSHIFTAAVREVLETKYLAEVSQQPITLPQFHLLKLISLNGHHQVHEIADFLGVSSPAATKNIDKLERLDLVSRTPCLG